MYQTSESLSSLSTWLQLTHNWHSLTRLRLRYSGNTVPDSGETVWLSVLHHPGHHTGSHPVIITDFLIFRDTPSQPSEPALYTLYTVYHTTVVHPVSRHCTHCTLSWQQYPDTLSLFIRISLIWLWRQSQSFQILMYSTNGSLKRPLPSNHLFPIIILKLHFLYHLSWRDNLLQTQSYIQCLTIVTNWGPSDESKYSGILLSLHWLDVILRELFNVNDALERWTLSGYNGNTRLCFASLASLVTGRREWNHIII